MIVLKILLDYVCMSSSLLFRVISALFLYARGIQMLRTEKFLFQCELAPHDWKQSLLPSQKILHLKGFGSGFEDVNLHPLPRSVIQIIEDHDVIVFDGDDFGEFSFTRYLAFYGHIIKNKTVIAFKFAHVIDQFIYSWHGNTIHIDVEEDSSEGLSPRSLYLAGRIQEGDVNDHHLIQIYYVPLLHPNPDETLVIKTARYLPQNDHLYLYLGREALSQTNANTVLTIGGGTCLADEYYHSPNHVEWFVYDLHRIKNNTRDETPLKSLPLRDNHERRLLDDRLYHIIPSAHHEDSVI